MHYWSGRPQEPQIQVIAIILVCPTELDGKTLFLKTPHTLVSGHTEINLKLTGKLPAG